MQQQKSLFPFMWPQTVDLMWGYALQSDSIKRYCTFHHWKVAKSFTNSLKQDKNKERMLKVQKKKKTSGNGQRSVWTNTFSVFGILKGSTMAAE